VFRKRALWEKLLTHVEQIRTFIADNREHLKRKA